MQWCRGVLSLDGSKHPHVAHRALRRSGACGKGNSSGDYRVWAHIRKIVVILVNARNAPAVSFDKDPSPPGLITVLNTVATVPMDNYSFDTVELLQKTFRNWQDDRRHLYKNPRDAYTPCSPPPKNLPAQGLQPLDLYPIVVGFEQIEDGEEYLGHNRDWYLSLPTSFVLKKDQVDTIREFAGALLDKTDTFKALRKCLE